MEVFTWLTHESIILITGHADRIMDMSYDNPLCCILHSDKHQGGKKNKIDQNNSDRSLQQGKWRRHSVSIFWVSMYSLKWFIEGYIPDI
jgi:hypothetical protein